MTRAVLFAALLVLSASTGGVQGALTDGGTLQAVDPAALLDGGPRMLTVGEPARSGFNGTTIDLGAAVGMGTAETAAAYDTYQLRARLERANASEESAVIEAAIARFGQELSALRQRERRAARQYAAGEISERTFLRRLASIHAAASAMKAPIDALVAATSTSDQFARAKTLSHRRQSMTGPVRETLAAGLTTTPRTERVFVAASENGVTLALVDRGAAQTTYVRETVRFDNLDDVPTTTFRNVTALPEYVSERYPWAWDNFRRWDVVFPGGIHRFHLFHPRGDFVSFTDGSTRRVFREIHSLQVDELPTSWSQNVTNDSIELVLNGTFAGGPMRIATTEGESNPVAAVVRVDGERIGTTGPDGVLWAIEPRGRFNVSATADGVNVTVTA